ncbi:MAG: hypothetical protein HQL60_06600, partial [Magnetococcales bacterium]|nr:hypothetical protein [Magnetococcales bacterium]
MFLSSPRPLQSMQSWLRVRLRASFSVVITIMLVFGLFALTTMRELAQQTVDLFEHPFTVSTALLRIE